MNPLLSRAIAARDEAAAYRGPDGMGALMGWADSEMEVRMIEEQDGILEQAKDLCASIIDLPLRERIATLNKLRLMLHECSPFKSEPVDCVLWVEATTVGANNYNPNAVAPPEMALLEHSIVEDGYTQPIVAWETDGKYEVVDGFHRHRIGRESAVVRQRINGYLPLVRINSEREDRGDRIASTIRHNRARGKHQVQAMSDIVIELKRRNWSDARIGKELGMDPDEVLRLCQITGLAELFSDELFSRSWDIEHFDEDSVGEVLSDDATEEVSAASSRIHHTWDKWECYTNGFYEDCPNGMTQEEGQEQYRLFLADSEQFENALKVVCSEWKHSCEHYLTNDRMNRIAWLGQAAVAQAKRIPSTCRGGYNLLTESQKTAADELALKYLNIWLTENGRETVTHAQALSRTEAELY